MSYLEVVEEGLRRRFEEENQICGHKREAVVQSPCSETHSFEETVVFSNSLSRSSQPRSIIQTGSCPFSSQPYDQSYYYCKKISIPSRKVSVIMGKGGSTLKSLQLQSGGKILITKDTLDDPFSLTWDVEINGTSEQVSKAEQLVVAAIVEAEKGGPSQPCNQHGHGEQIEMNVPNGKVASYADFSDHIELTKLMVNEVVAPVPSGFPQPVETITGASASLKDPSLVQQTQYRGGSLIQLHLMLIILLNNKLVGNWINLFQ